MREANNDIIAALQRTILPLQGFRQAAGDMPPLGLGVMENAFPYQRFPVHAVHEFISRSPETAAATCGFVCSLLNRLLQQHNICIWVSTGRTIFPPALQAYGIMPHHVIFIDVQQEKDALWVMEEALKSGAASVVVGEIKNMDFTASRRLQLAVEQSMATGFVLRHTTRLNTTASIARWQISPLGSVQEDLPGVGFPRWKVALLKIRNGRPGVWEVSCGGVELSIAIPEKIPVWPIAISAYGSAI